MTITVKNHIVSSYVYGGPNLSASVTLWIDEAAKVAHLVAHSGSTVPLNGPAAPAGAPTFRAAGREGYVADFDQDHIGKQITHLEHALTSWVVGDDNPAVGRCIEDILAEFDLAELSFEEWRAELHSEAAKAG